MNGIDFDIIIIRERYLHDRQSQTLRDREINTSTWTSIDGIKCICVDNLY